MKRSIIFLSSTVEDMKKERNAITEVVTSLNQDISRCEYYPARSQSPKEICLEQAQSCDIFIGIYKRRYGFIPKEHNSQLISVVDMEYQKAKESKKPTLMFIHADEKDRDPKLAEFLKNIKNFSYGNFVKTYKNIDELKYQVLHSVVSHLLNSVLLTDEQKYGLVNLIPDSAILNSQQHIKSHFGNLLVSSPVNIIGSGFDGIDATQGGTEPPDVQVAVGPANGNVFEMVNVYGQTYTRQGSLNQTFTLSTLFKFSSSDNSYLSDPKILYDSQSGRWFASIVDTINDTVGIAVSKTSDPSINNWYVHHQGYDTISSAECPDQPKIGVSDDKFVVSANDFGFPVGDNCRTPNITPTTDGAEYRVFDKTQMESGTFNVYKNGPNTSDFAVTPVQSMSTTQPLYMVSDGAVSSTNQIRLFNVTGTVSSGIHINTSTVNLSRNILTPADAPQPITSTILDTSDTRILDAVWKKGSLWFSLDDGCTPKGDSAARSCARLIQLNTNNTSVIQDFDINATNTYYYYPALRLDGFGGMGTIVGISNSTIYPSLEVTGQSLHDPVKTVKQLMYLKGGSNYYDTTPYGQDGDVRYGDYFGAGMDPLNSTQIWLAGEYIKNSPSHNLTPTWSTFIGSITFDCVPPTTGDWTVTASCTLASSATPAANVIIQNNSLLTIPNGVSLNIDFAHYHLLVNSGSGVYVVPGGKIS